MTSARRTSRTAGDALRQARRAARRAELLDAAVVAIRRDGPAVSMEAIAAQAGVTKPIVYKHFGDRGGLVQALAVGFVDDLLAEVQGALEQDAPPRQLLVTTVDAYLAFVERDPNVYRFLVQRALGDAQAGEAMAWVMAEIGQRVASVLGEQLRAAGLDSGAAEPWAFGIVGMVHLAGDWWLARRTMPRTRLVSYLADLLWNGLGHAEGMQLAEVGGPAPRLRVVAPQGVGS